MICSVGIRKPGTIYLSSALHVCFLCHCYFTPRMCAREPAIGQSYDVTPPLPVHTWPRDLARENWYNGKNYGMTCRRASDALCARDEPSSWCVVVFVRLCRPDGAVGTRADKRRRCTSATTTATACAISARNTAARAIGVSAACRTRRRRLTWSSGVATATSLSGTGGCGWRTVNVKATRACETRDSWRHLSTAVTTMMTELPRAPHRFRLQFWFAIFRNFKVLTDFMHSVGWIKISISVYFLLNSCAFSADI